MELSSLTQWSIQHIRSIFEAPTDEDSLLAISETFSDTVTAVLNGKALSREGINHLVLSMRSSGRLKVDWHQTVEVPLNTNNRDGSFGGMYHISGIRKQQPGQDEACLFERRKIVTVQIQSQDSDLNTDSRRITNLVFVASDFRVE